MSINSRAIRSAFPSQTFFVLLIVLYLKSMVDRGRFKKINISSTERMARKRTRLKSNVPDVNQFLSTSKLSM